LEKGTKLSVILKLAGEMATMPGVVRHRTESRMGMSFEREILAPGSQEEKSFANILGILERAVNRRSSTLSKEESNPSAGLPGSEPAQRTGETPLTQTATTYSSQDRRQQERRREPRIPILQGIPIRAEVVTPDRILRPVRCVDLSPHGALLDFGTGKCPPLNLDAQVLVNLQIGSDTANIPSLVRHRTNSRIGVEFPFDRQAHLQDQEKSLVSILRTLERAISRRRGR